ncbi:hypothetical protein BOX15_Mlig032202g1 [Macrostomum lignano]|uniref:receptor protein serine/threonine kinase n=1 Tax=Macrostomum lignano TaxID=282301 RepID=A0A267H644_9PLAT|nr:hypothetical protein BOX15_Mlig032202g1 [Macrostomum lignano]
MYSTKIILIISILYFVCEECLCRTSICVYSPHIMDFPVSMESFEPKNDYSYCQQNLISSDMIKAWNSNVHVSIMFHQLYSCVMVENGSYIKRNESCFKDVKQQFRHLINKPLCCTINLPLEHSKCYMSTNDLCKSMNVKRILNYNANGNSLAINTICNQQLYQYTECNNLHNDKQTLNFCKVWNKNILTLNYVSFGCLTRRQLIADSPSAESDATVSLLAGSFCHLSPGRNCCKNGSLCNLAEAMPLIDAQQQAVRLSNLSQLRFGPPRQPGGWTAASAFASAVAGFVGLAALATAAAGLVLACQRCGGLPRRDKLNRLLARMRLFRGRRGGAADADSVRDQNVLMQRLHQEQEAGAEGRLHQHELASVWRQQQQQGCSSSGYGNPHLVRRTIARDTTVDCPVGQGRFGQVFRGTWRTGEVSDTVAVKIFHSRAEASWSREGEIYATPGLAHPSILGFIAIDNVDAGWETQLWLITDYHANGSLQTYLMEHSISCRVAAGMCHSIVTGLAHLHTELISAGFVKPGIAHCDVKSNNILVKADLTCCLADFGLAVRETDELRRDGDRRVGTVRYLSPELLDGGPALGSFANLQQADLYALGLVLWEVGQRCLGPYSLPYAEWAPANPSLDDMRQLVCRPRCARPALPADAWLAGGPVCRVLADGLLAALWHPEPGQRLGALGVKQRTAGLLGAAAGQD